MATFRYKGFTYDLIIKPWKKNGGKFEAIRWETGFKFTWERIPYDEYKRIEKEKNTRTSILK